MKIPIKADNPVPQELLGKKLDLSPRATQDNLPGSWFRQYYGNSGCLAIAYGKPVSIGSTWHDVSQIEADILAFIHTNAQAMGVAGCDLKIEYVKQLPKFASITVKPFIDDIPVYSAQIILTLSRSGEVGMVQMRGFGSDTKGNFSINKSQALNIACEHAGVSNQKHAAEKVWLPEQNLKDQISLQACYRIELNSDRPWYQPIVYVNADNGEILAAENPVYFFEASGDLQGSYKPLYGPDESEVSPFPYEYLRFYDDDSLFTGADGAFEYETENDTLPLIAHSELRGLFAEVHEWEEEDGALRSEFDNVDEPITLLWDDDNSSLDERNLYYHINFIHDHWKTIDPEFDGLDFPFLGVCGVYDPEDGRVADNAFSVGMGGIYFGRGNRWDNFALYADVIYHEYTHSVTAVIYSGHNLPYEGESGALNEAWSDYFPCSLTNEPLLGEGGLLGNGRIRNIDNNLRFPDSWQGEVHADSRIISAAMWHTREILGAQYCDSLFHFAKYLHGNDFASYMAGILITDDDDFDITNGSPNYTTIYENFYRHGILTSDTIFYSLRDIILTDDLDGGNANGVFEPGETVGIDLEVFRSGRARTDDVDIALASFTSESDDVVSTNQEVIIDNFDLADIKTLPELLTFEIEEDAELAFVDLVVYLAMMGKDPVPYDTVRFVIGQPEVLLVRDDIEEHDHIDRIKESLEAMEIVYAEHQTWSDRVAVMDYLPLFRDIIWCTGNARDENISEASRNAIIEFINGGGNIILNGQDISSPEGNEEFLNEYFGAETVLDSTSKRDLIGVDGDPITSDMQLLLQGGNNGAQNQRSPDVIVAIEPAVNILRYNRIEGQPAAAVRMEHEDSGAKTIYCGFGLEGINGVAYFAYRDELLERIFNWFHGGDYAPNGPHLPISFALGNPFPNPFNHRTTVPFVLPASGEVQLKIFDLQGRLVHEELNFFNSGRNLWTLDARDWSAGTYEVLLKTAGYDGVRQVLLVK